MISDKVYYDALKMIEEVNKLDKIAGFNLNNCYQRRDMIRNVLIQAFIEGEGSGERKERRKVAQELCQKTSGHKWIRISTEEQASAGIKEYQCDLCGATKSEYTGD